MPIMSFFNHKGGVGKTTLVHNLAFAMAAHNKRILVIDADPQMNLTASLYGLSTSIEYSTNNYSVWSRNVAQYISIKEYLDSKTKNKHTDKAIYHKAIANSGCVDLIGGDIALANTEFEIFGIVTNPSDFTESIPGQIQQAIDDLADEYDYVLIDTSPSASSIINALLVLTSNYLIAPVTPSFFSLQAIDNLSDVFRQWINHLSRFQTTRSLKGINIRVQFLGLVVQMAKHFKGYSGDTRSWVDDLNNSVDAFVQYTNKINLTVTEAMFKEIFPDSEPYIIELCCDFTDKLRGIAEKNGVPVILIPEEDKTLKAEQYRKSFDSIVKSYNNIADSLLKL